MRKHGKHTLPKAIHTISAEKHFKVNLILIGELNIWQLIFKKEQHLYQSKIADFSHEVLEQVKSSGKAAFSQRLVLFVSRFLKEV